MSLKTSSLRIIWTFYLKTCDNQDLKKKSGKLMNALNFIIVIIQFEALETTAHRFHQNPRPCLLDYIPCNVGYFKQATQRILIQL